MSANFWVMRGRQASNDPKICTNDEFFPQIFQSRKVGNDICFIMTFFRIPVRKTSGENSHWNEENTVKMIQIQKCCCQMHRPKAVNYFLYHFDSIFLIPIKFFPTLFKTKFVKNVKMKQSSFPNLQTLPKNRGENHLSCKPLGNSSPLGLSGPKNLHSR